MSKFPSTPYWMQCNFRKWLALLSKRQIRDQPETSDTTNTVNSVQKFYVKLSETAKVWFGFFLSPQMVLSCHRVKCIYII